MTIDYYDELRAVANDFRSLEWERNLWANQPALVSKSKKRVCQYLGQEYDPNEYDLVENSWDHDHCAFCNITIKDCDCGKCVKEGYKNGGSWLCPDCYSHIIKNGEDPESYLKT
ncbi:MAG: hypothetical protein GY845_15390 [Planctomycetes bacterium]|nr:hypothetical protein [Planctomycetota bacterium]